MFHASLLKSGQVLLKFRHLFIMSIPLSKLLVAPHPPEQGALYKVVSLLGSARQLPWQEFLLYHSLIWVNAVLQGC